MSALNGIRVIDMSAVLMGPLSGRILGDMGADVIKVESLDGDSVRAIGPMRRPGMGPFFMNANRNKRGLALDLKSEQGKEVLRRLIKTADILIYNARPQAMARLGFDYDACRAINPGLVYVGAFGFGQDGPYAARPAYDDLIQGLSGIPSLIGRAGDHDPQYVPLAIVDRFVGVSVVNAILGALVHKLRTGQGQSVDVPMFETMADVVLSDHSSGATFDPPLGPIGYPRSLAKERRPFKTRDGYICVMLYLDSQWKAFFKLIGSDRGETDPRFASITTRTVHASEVHQVLEQHLRERTTEEWLRDLQQQDIPAVPMHTLETLVEDPHLQAIGFFEWRDHPSQGRVRTMRHATRWSETPLVNERHAPALGQHSREVLREAGYSEAEIDGLFSAGVTCSQPETPAA